MRLERLYFDINGVEFGDKSSICGRTLILNKHELESLLASREFELVEIDIVRPGSNVRILNVGDVVQPMLRLGSEDTTFPGLLGNIQTVGNGRSITLRGVAVTEVVEMTVDIPCLLQMTENASDVTEFADMWHITLDAFPAQGVLKHDYLKAVHLASKRLAKYVASLAAELEPCEIKVFELEHGALSNLPRVAYLANLFCHRPFTDSLVYGASMMESLPTILHPNEILDGALLGRDYDNAMNADPTYVWQNNPIILELYSRHGIDLNFVGVVVNNVHHELSWKERNAMISTSLLNNNLRAEAVIITKEGGGHPQVDVGLQVDILEKEYGIKTVAVLVEMLSHSNDSYGQLIFKSDYADAIVSTGCTETVTLPPPSKEIGTAWSSREGMGEGTLGEAGELTTNYRMLRSSQSQLGWTRFGSQKF